jgi:hypothetical protein
VGSHFEIMRPLVVSSEITFGINLAKFIYNRFGIGTKFLKIGSKDARAESPMEC